MSERENPNIEELLNSFIDGELTEREQTEVQRLISHDAQIAQRLRELQKTKMLVGSLPRAETPARILDGIKASLEGETLLAERAWSEEPSDRRVGVRHLLARKVLAAAAMIGLVAILSAVVYTIVAPESDYKPAVPAVAFDGRLELKTDALSTVNASINKAIEDNGLSDSIKLTSQGNKRVYSITCNREDLNSLLADLTGIWERCDSTTLVVRAKMPGRQVVFEDVSTERIAKIVEDLTTIPKPDLTAGDEDKEATEKPSTRVQREGQVHLSIVVAGSE